MIAGVVLAVWATALVTVPVAQDAAPTTPADVLRSAREASVYDPTDDGLVSLVATCELHHPTLGLVQRARVTWTSGEDVDVEWSRELASTSWLRDRGLRHQWTERIEAAHALSLGTETAVPDDAVVSPREDGGWIAETEFEAMDRRTRHVYDARGLLRERVRWRGDEALGRTTYTWTALPSGRWVLASYAWSRPTDVEGGMTIERAVIDGVVLVTSTRMRPSAAPDAEPRVVLRVRYDELGRTDDAGR